MASGRSIRFKISALLVIPLISLVALWGFAAGTTSGEAFSLLKVQTIWTGVIDHADDVVGNLQGERLATAERLAGLPKEPAAVAKARAATDASRKTLTEQANSDDVQAALTQEMKTQLTAVFTAIDRLAVIRRQVDDGGMTPTTLVTEYTAISDAVHRLYATFALSTDVELYRQASGLIAADQVRELLSRENALIVAANANLGDEDRRLLAKIDGARTFLLPKALSDLDEELRAPFVKATTSSRYITMEGYISGLLSGGKVSIEVWRGTADPVFAEYADGIGNTGDLLLGRMEPAGIAIIARAGIAGVLGLIAVVFSVFISIRVGRVITRELAGLRRTALDLAEVRLPRVVDRLRRGEQVDIEQEAPPITVAAGATSEVTDLATAFDSVQRTAVDAAVEQARLRESISEALRNLARRSQSLVQRQLRLLDDMQRDTEDPEALERLFRLDHLTTRMRRHAEGLVLLSGGTAGRRWRGTIPFEDVLSGAAAQVEEYTRVRVYPMPECGVSGAAVADLMHLFAELIENAATFSSPGNEVSVRGELVGRGFAVEIEDRGLGMAPEERQAINDRLAGQQDFDLAQTERLGFAVVGLLAAKHRVTVTLKPSPYGGTTAIVLVPAALIEAAAMPERELVSVSVMPNRTDAMPSRTDEVQLPRRMRAARRSELAPAPAPAPAPVQAEEQQDPELPRRVRQANLPQRLKQTQQQAAAPAEERSPEEARALLSSLQSGWQRGRQDSDQDGSSDA